MELEFKCLTNGCKFVGKVDWPEYKTIDGDMVLDSQVRGKSDLTEHHRFTRPVIQGAHGHMDFQTEYKNKTIKVEVSGNCVIFAEDSFDSLYGDQPSTDWLINQLD